MEFPVCANANISPVVTNSTGNNSSSNGSLTQATVSAVPARTTVSKATTVSVRVNVQYMTPANATVDDVLQMFRSSTWVNFMVRYIVPYLKSSTPASKTVLDSLEEWTSSCNAHEEDSCVICMNTMERATKLPCGHKFHTDCIDSWLKLRSTCPTCRYQFQKSIFGSYAIRAINTALIVSEEPCSKEALLTRNVGGTPVKAVVNVTLVHASTLPYMAKYPCVLNAVVLQERKKTNLQTVTTTSTSSIDSNTSHVRRRSYSAANATGTASNSLYLSNDQQQNKRVKT